MRKVSKRRLADLELNELNKISNNWTPLFGNKLCASKLLQGPLHSGSKALDQFWSNVLFLVGTNRSSLPDDFQVISCLSRLLLLL